MNRSHITLLYVLTTVDLRTPEHGYNPLPMMIRRLLCVVLAAVLAASAGGALAQGFGSVSSGKPMPPDEAPSAAAPLAPAGSSAEAAPSAAASPAPGASSAEATPAPAAYSSRPAAAPAEPGPSFATPANCEAGNPFMTGSAAAEAGKRCEALNPFMSGSVASLAAPTASSVQVGSGESGTAVETATTGGTVPFGGAYSAAIAASAHALESADRVLVKKSNRRLYLLRSNRIIADYPIRLGLNPRGPKLREGDFRTPEGVYELSRRNPHSDFFLSLEVSYPNASDRDRARETGVKPGGLIMIHGQPNAPRKSPVYYASNDWTDGCIAVSNSDMVEIWLRTSVGTPIEIRP